MGLMLLYKVNAIPLVIGITTCELSRPLLTGESGPLKAGPENFMCINAVESQLMSKMGTEGKREEREWRKGREERQV